MKLKKKSSLVSRNAALGCSAPLKSTEIKHYATYNILCLLTVVVSHSKITISQDMFENKLVILLSRYVMNI